MADPAHSIANPLADTWEEPDLEDLPAMIAIRDEVLAIKMAPRRKKLRERYLQNKENADEVQRIWRASNRERVCQRQRGYSARRRSKTRQGMSGAETRRWVLKQTKICHWCGVPCQKGFHIDHIKPLARGGAHEKSNLCIACKTCNLTKHAKDPIDFARSKGLLL